MLVVNEFALYFTVIKDESKYPTTTSSMVASSWEYLAIPYTQFLGSFTALTAHTSTDIHTGSTSTLHYTPAKGTYSSLRGQTQCVPPPDSTNVITVTVQRNVMIPRPQCPRMKNDGVPPAVGQDSHHRCRPPRLTHIRPVVTTLPILYDESL